MLKEEDLQYLVKNVKKDGYERELIESFWKDLCAEQEQWGFEHCYYEPSKFNSDEWRDDNKYLVQFVNATYKKHEEDYKELYWRKAGRKNFVKLPKMIWKKLYQCIIPEEGFIMPGGPDENATLYGIFDGEKLVYVGKTTRPFEVRKNEHLKAVEDKSELDLYRYFWENNKEVEIRILYQGKASDGQISYKEQAIIELCQPEFNIEGNTKPYRYRNIDMPRIFDDYRMRMVNNDGDAAISILNSIKDTIIQYECNRDPEALAEYTGVTIEEARDFMDKSSTWVSLEQIEKLKEKSNTE